MAKKKKKGGTGLAAIILIGLIIIVCCVAYIWTENNKENIDNNELQSTTQGLIEPTSEVQKETETLKNLSSVLEIEYYMEQPDTNYKTYARPEKVKGIYVSGPRAGSSKYMPELIELAKETEINAMVIDIKNDSGEVTYKMDIPAVVEAGSGVNYIKDIEGLIETLNENNIYPIARIVVFKDSYIAEKRPDLTIKNKDGSVWRDKSNIAWVNPYNKDVWDYVIDIAKEAANVGFKEIQFDYIRFSTDSRMKNADFGELAETMSRTEIITEFTKYAYEQLSPLGVYVSADVYGTIINSKTDADIVGQDYVEMSKYLDYICPMVYPSHYANGSMKIQYPDLDPYNVIYKSMGYSNEELAKIPEGEHKAIVRPWLQAFTATWLANYQTYGGKQIREQIQAVYDAGLEEWILWNGSCSYTSDGLEKE